MALSDSSRAEVLIQAFPYIERFRGRTVVVKYGGAAMVNEGIRTAVVEDLLFMASVGIRTVLVHGGGPEIDGMLRRLGKEPQFIGGLRFTDSETMEVVQMVLAGKVNKDLVALIQRGGGRALGLCGADGGLLTALPREAGPDLGLVGEITQVDPRVVNLALDSGLIPVIATVAMGGTEDEAFYNVNADTAAAEIAVALGAEKLVLLTDVPGLLRDPQDPATLIAELPRTEVPGLVKAGIVSKGMIPKVECCARAVEGGVKRSHIIDGRSPHSLLLEVFSDRGIGTMIV